jgi:quaternary ammonium compound-resistance protein SugE
MAWLAVIVAGLFETGFALALKASEGFTRPLATAAFIVCAVISFSLLSWGLRTLPVGPAYAVWTGIGAAGTALAGIALFGEPATAVKLASIGLIVAGVAGLQLSGSGHA